MGSGEALNEHILGDRWPEADVRLEMLDEAVGPDIEKHVESLRQYADAGVDELFVHQIGPERDAFFDTWAREVLPRFA